MPKKVPLEKHTLRLRAGDIQFLRDKFPKVPVNRTVRFIISREVDKLNPPLTDQELQEIENDSE